METCPKCGSDLEYEIVGGDRHENGYRCTNKDCKMFWSYVKLSHEKTKKTHQLRTGKLLKHFKKDSEIHYTYVVKKSLEIWYNVEIEKFYIGYQMGFGRIEIPFKAVEVWINSLEIKS